MLSQEFSDCLSLMKAIFDHAHHEGQLHSILNVMLAQGFHKITCVEKYVLVYLQYLVKIADSLLVVQILDRADVNLDLFN